MIRFVLRDTTRLEADEEKERLRADAAEKRANRLAEKLRSLGIEP